MDGPALLGLPTLYLTDAPNVRMRAWVGTVPGYTELVREEGFLDRATETLARWAGDVPADSTRHGSRSARISTKAQSSAW